MSTLTVSQETIKNRAKVIREMIKAESGVDLSHGQCLKIVSQLFGFNNWNTAKAMLPLNIPKSAFEDLAEPLSKGYSISIERPYQIDADWGPQDRDDAEGVHFECGVDSTVPANFRIDSENKKVILELQSADLGMNDSFGPQPGWNRAVDKAHCF